MDHSTASDSFDGAHIVLRRAAELAMEYLRDLPDRHVDAITGYDEVLDLLSGPVPEHATDAVAVVQRLAAILGPATIASAGPRYFGLVVGGSLPAALAADWLVSTWDQTAYSRMSSPAGAAVDAVTEQWILQVLGLPTEATVGFVTGATAGNTVGLLAARHVLLQRQGWDVEADGLTQAPRVRVIAGDEVHPSVLQAIQMIGLGARLVERVAVDDQGAMCADALADALAADPTPAIVCAQVGNVNSGACDPMAQIVDLTREHGGWVHVDGAFGLWAQASPRLSELVAGVERADSWSTDAHKWLNVPYDCGLSIVNHPDAARAALGATTSYLPTSTAREPGVLVPEMSRRSRAVPVYAALASLGRPGVQALIERCCDHARRLADAVRDDAGFIVCNDVVLNQVLVRVDDDETTWQVCEHVRHSGEAWVAGTVWHSRAAVRVSFSNWATTDDDVDRLANALRDAATALRTGG
jgi:glutamate/tyrosine decarboxylase-like PLP-dependent enzyme